MAFLKLHQPLAWPSPGAPSPVPNPSMIPVPTYPNTGMGKTSTPTTNPLEPVRTLLPSVAPLAPKKNLVGVPTVPFLPVAREQELATRDLLPPPPQDKKRPVNYASAIINGSRLLTGAIMAGQPVPMPTISDGMRKYMDEVTEKKNQGLLASQHAAANQAISNNYQQGVSALTRGAGGGSTAGVLQAGLTALAQQRNRSTANLSDANVAAQQANFERYSAMTGQVSLLQSALEQERINRAAATQQIGTGLVGSTLEKMEDQRVYNQNQGLYNQYQQSQIDANNESTLTQQAIRKKYGAPDPNQPPAVLTLLPQALQRR